MRLIRMALLSCVLFAGCGSDNSPAPAPTSASSGNVLTVSIGASDVCTIINEPCAEVTICQTGTPTCQVVSDVLIDIGSVGLRVFRSVLSPPLPLTADSQGRQLGECAFFADGGASWGAVQVADVSVAGGPPVRIPIQVVDPTFAGQSPSQNPCNNPVDSDPGTVGFNGILGLGVFREDCGPVCAANANNNLYFACVMTACGSVAVPLSEQLQNPIWLRPTDNNGLVLSLPGVPADGAQSVSGSLIAGIGTSPNNSPPAGLVVLTTDENGLITTLYKGRTIGQSIIDSGSNGYFFPDSTLPACAMPLASFYCPPNPVSLSASLVGTNGRQAIVPFQIGNTENLLQTGHAAFDNVGGQLSIFDWGIPFFLGRSVYVGIDGQESALGTGPFFAF